IVQHAAEGSVRIEVQAWHANFLYSQAEMGGLHPELQRHAPACLGDVQRLDRTTAIGLEAAERIRDFETVASVDFARDRRVDRTAVGRGWRVLAKIAKV